MLNFILYFEGEECHMNTGIMQKTAAYAEQIKQVNAVLDYIHDNLDSPLGLTILSAVAGFSPYHFHRIFHSIVQETLNQYVARVRVEKASRLLTSQVNRSLTDIGLECGFLSSAAFSRAFRTVHGMTPTEYRQQFSLFKTRSITFAEEHFRVVTQGSHLNSKQVDEAVAWALHHINQAKVTHLPPVKVLAIRQRGLSDQRLNRELSNAFDTAYRKAHMHGLLPPSPEIIGVSYDDPYVTPQDRCRYDACVTVIPDADAHDDLDISTLPGGKYAVIDISGNFHLLWLLSGLLTQSWLPRSGYTIDDDRPVIEIHKSNPHTDPAHYYQGKWCLPIKAK